MKYYQYIILLGFFCFLTQPLISQEERKKKTYYQPAFEAMKIGNLQSTKVANKREFFLYVSHRFGSVKGSISTFFGLDNASTKIELVYGLADGVQIGLSRESVKRTYAGTAKIRLLKQKNKSPFNIVAYATINLNTELDKDRYPNMKYPDRLSFAYQLLLSRRIHDRVSLELAPTFIRQNLVYESFQNHNQFGLGLGGRFRITKLVSITLDYTYNFSRAKESIYTNPLTLGIDIETGGHVFQLLFANAQSSNEPGFMSNAEGNWSKGDVFFGFNVVRIFK